MLLNKFFAIVDTCLSCEDIAHKVVRWCQVAIFGDFFASCISASRVQHASDLHLKFALMLSDRRGPYLVSVFAQQQVKQKHVRQAE